MWPYETCLQILRDRYGKNLTRRATCNRKCTRKLLQNNTIDVWGSTKSFNNNKHLKKTGILRSVLAGGSVSNKEMKQGLGLNKTLCKCGKQDSIMPQMWECPTHTNAWKKIFTDQPQAGPPLALHPLTVQTGLLPQDSDLLTNRDNFEKNSKYRAEPTTAPKEGNTVFTDASVISQKDPLLRRAAWTCSWYTGEDKLETISGTATSKANILRAET